MNTPLMRSVTVAYIICNMVLRGKKSSSEVPLCLRDENKLEEKDWAIISSGTHYVSIAN
ncbi:hypothetical protein BKA56DRAFT_600037, partial [Ilyonectria sp. MPI-CAGE-AT-0026]